MAANVLHDAHQASADVFSVIEMIRKVNCKTSTCKLQNSYMWCLAHVPDCTRLYQTVPGGGFLFYSGRGVSHLPLQLL